MSDAPSMTWSDVIAEMSALRGPSYAKCHHLASYASSSAVSSLSSRSASSESLPHWVDVDDRLVTYAFDFAEQAPPCNGMPPWPVQVALQDVAAKFPQAQSVCADDSECAQPRKCGKGPCKFYATKRGCKDGSFCGHCHVCPWKMSMRRTRNRVTFASAGQGPKLPGESKVEPNEDICEAPGVPLAPDRRVQLCLDSALGMHAPMLILS